MSGEVILVLGPVGAGKSTLVNALRRERRALAFVLDEWMAALFGDDERPADRMRWYVERTERCIAQIWRETERASALGIPVVLEIGLIQRAARERFYERLDGLAHEIIIVDAPREVRRERVKARNRERGDTFSMEVPMEVFELASDLWEPPSAEELAGRTFSRR